ncbi:MAG TPA: carbohydrate ABC transporter permease [Candidatus Limnocylindrales bacterium]|nr:carbohydrate ABC transporter permease [Candidatus Limnocylindrales bacterium]
MSAGVPAVAAVRPGRRQRTSLLGFVSVRVAITAIAVLWTVPTAGLLVSSFRSNADIRATGWWEALLHPFELTTWTLTNYGQVLAADGLAGAFVNSLVVTIPATAIPITMAAFAAYAFAWMRFPGRSLLFALIVALLVVPLQMSLVPVLRMFTATDLNGTFLGIWLAHTGFGLPLAVYLLYNYISQLPGELMESASIDGASHFAIFRRIVVPLSVPALASFAIFQFLWVWNDLLIALVYLGTDSTVAVLPARLRELVGTKGESWHLLTAAAFVTMVVPFAVFLLLQRYFVRGLIAGSVKG